MAIEVTYYYNLLGSNGKQTALRFASKIIDTGTLSGDLDAAQANADAIRAELVDVTEANLNGWGFIYDGGGLAGGLPAAADIFEEALVQVDITPAGEPNKYANIRIPAPDQAMFVGTTGAARDLVDITHGDLDAYFQVTRCPKQVSDGEDITGGMVSGSRRVKARRF